jgi:hypothetical protein
MDRSWRQEPRAVKKRLQAHKIQIAVSLNLSLNNQVKYSNLLPIILLLV